MRRSLRRHNDIAPANPHPLPSGAIVQVLTPSSLRRLWTAAPNLPPFGYAQGRERVERLEEGGTQGSPSHSEEEHNGFPPIQGEGKGGGGGGIEMREFKWD